MTVAVLGGTGFIGSWAVRALVAAGCHVVAHVRQTSSTWRLDGVQGVDIVRSDDWAATLGALAPDVVLSLDWAGVSKADRDSDQVQQGNVTRMTALATAAFAAGTGRFVGVGSQGEYGPIDEAINEDMVTSPTTAYGRAKVAARESLASAAAAAHGQYVWARVFSVFGPLETGEWLLPSLARAAEAGRQVSLSSGTQAWSYLYAPDAGTALAELVLNPLAHGVYNVGHPSAPPLRDSVATYLAALGSTETAQFGRAPGPRLEPDVGRLRSLGWAPAFAVDEGLIATAKWMRGEVIPDPLLPGALPRPPR